MNIRRPLKKLLPLTTAAILASQFADASIQDGMPYSVELDQAGFKIDGQYKLLRGGTIQWFRIPEAAWRDRLERFKAAGFNTIDMYVAWNQIEKTEGQFDFETPNIRRFLDLCQELGIYVYFRPGPYITNEMDGGGVPGWLMDKTTKKSIEEDGKLNLRTEDPDYLAYVERYFNKLNQVIKPYLASNGGPIILYSVENEYNWFEIFHEVDKLFWYEGGPERDLFAPLPTRNYFTALRDMVEGDGIDVPITTCPGDGKASATGDVARVIPMPNVYGPSEPEKIAYDLLQDMHNPGNHDGVYVNYPTGTTETDREPINIKRMLMGGMDAAFAFNIAGYHQQGKMNAVVLDINGDITEKVFDFSKLENILTGYLSPTVGYFHNVVDYNGAISPSAQLRDKYYSFRRDNLFFDSFEQTFASATHANRSGHFSGADNRLTINSQTLGAPEGKSLVHYWHEAPSGEKFISIVNTTGTDQTININGISLDGQVFPRFTEFTSKPELDDNGGRFGHVNDHSAMILVADHSLGNVHLDYSTSEILHLGDFNNEKLLVVYGHEGTQGEIQLSGLGGTGSVDFIDRNVSINEHLNDKLTLSFDYIENSQAVLRANGKTLRILITTKPAAAKTWFASKGGNDFVIAGPDYLTYNDSDEFDDISIEYDKNSESITVISSASPTSIAGLTRTQIQNPSTLTTQYQLPTSVDAPTIPGDLISQGKSKSDNAEISESFDDSQWTQWQGDPNSIESLGTIKGHVWYRAELELTGWNWLPFWEPTDLYIEHASDIVGIYVNGTYLTTMAPLGTELDSDSWNRDYQYPSLRPYLKKGKNVIAFKVETWGHGSFMFPRGKLDGTAAQIPSVGFDAEKGLFGEAKVGWRQLENWSMRADLSGEIAGYQSESYDDAHWETKTFPGSLPKGDVHWYRTEFDTADLPNADQFHAPLVLALEGKNAKANIYLNGTLIGRWLSDEDWLSRGFWGRGTRDMWMNTNPDHFPMDRSLLKPAGEINSLAIVFEDTSSDVEDAGNIEKLAIEYAKENSGQSSIKNRFNLNLN